LVLLAASVYTLLKSSYLASVSCLIETTMVLGADRTWDKLGSAVAEDFLQT
jgi:hypothetical protein